MHLFLTGEIQIGKSTLIRSALARCDQERIGGFCTFTRWDPGDGNGYVHLVSWNREAVELTSENTVGIRWRVPVDNRYAEVFPAVFDTVGTEILTKGIPPACKLIVMDEIGWMERKAHCFAAQVLHCLDGEIPVLGVIKPRSAPLPDAVRNHPKVRIQCVTESNRNELLQVIREFVDSVWKENG